MEQFFQSSFGISAEVFHYVVLPLLVFFARVADVSFSTIRIVFVMSGKKMIAPILGFFEALIWLLAIGQIINNIDNIYSYLAYAGGFGTGTWVGMILEERIALGRVLVRVITQKQATELIGFMQEKELRYTNLDAHGNDGPVNLLFTVIKRQDLKELIETIKHFNPNAYYTIESVKRVSDDKPENLRRVFLQNRR